MSRCNSPTVNAAQMPGVIRLAGASRSSEKNGDGRAALPANHHEPILDRVRRRRAQRHFASARHECHRTIRERAARAQIKPVDGEMAACAGEVQVGRAAVGQIDQADHAGFAFPSKTEQDRMP